MKLTVFDKMTYSVSEREYTDNGFLRVPARVARTGTQEYLACELGLTDRGPNEIVVVNRPESSVFDEQSLASYNGSDVTIEHPSEFVAADNYGDLSKGTVLGAARDGDFVKATMIIKSKDAIEAIESGKVQVSAGYTAEYIKAEDGAGYDFEQKNIMINHVALVDRARAGAQARIFDHKAESEKMKITLDNGATVEIEASAEGAQLIKEAIDRGIEAAGQLDAAKATADAQAEKIESLESGMKQFTDGDFIKQAIAEVSKVKDSAALIAGKSFETDSVDTLEIKRQALAQVRDSIDWAEQSDLYVEAAFDFATADAKAKKESDDAEGKEDDEDKKIEKEENNGVEQRERSNDHQIQALSKDAKPTLVKSVDHDAKRKFIDSNRWKVSAGLMTESELNEQAKNA